MFEAFAPHGTCLLWNQPLLWLHVLSDSLTAFSYYSIPVFLLTLVRRRPDLPFRVVFLLFGAFIVSCGTTHLMDIWTLWRADYWLSGLLKSLTALISLYTALTLWPILPQILAVPSQAALAEANRRLQAEVEERQRMQCLLVEQMEQLQHLNRLKDAFLAAVSHELRTPLSNMSLAIRMLEGAPLEGAHQRYLEILKSECRRERDLINDLLDLQRVEAGGMQFTFEPVDLDALLAQLLPAFRQRFELRRQKLTTAIEPTVGTLYTDRACLERIVAELLNNACKYTPEGGAVRLAVHSEADRGIVLEVGNTGPEIPDEEKPHLFEKFYRGSRGRSEEVRGTGLGLALIREMLERIGGTIGVTSDPQETVFFVHLPFGQGQLPHSPAPISPGRG